MVCAHNLAYDEKPNYQMLKKILNPGGTPLGPLEFSTKGESVNVDTPNNQKVSNVVPGILRLPSVRLFYQMKLFWVSEGV